MISTRPITPGDIDKICLHREQMFREAGFDGDLGEMTRNFRKWLAGKIESGQYQGFLAQDGTKTVAGIGMIVLDWPPHPRHPGSAKRGYILKLFVEPPYRGQGIARDLMQRVEMQLKSRGISYAVLHATAQGRLLYEKGGWASANELAKTL